MTGALLHIELKREHDVVLARQRARQVAHALGLEQSDETRVATAVSELTRNALVHGGGGHVELALVSDAEGPSLVVHIVDHGPGIPDLAAVLEGRWRSSTGLGIGLNGSHRLVDELRIEPTPGGGTTVRISKRLPRATVYTPLRELEAHVADALARHRPTDPMQEILEQNQELVRTLGELRAQKEELAQVNRELDETNRGVVALLAELDEKAAYLQQANELKSKFLSNMTHEFRTPLNSIINLSRILLDRLDGDLTNEQEKQVRFIVQSAESLSELVNDLLDLAKVEAGKITVRPAEVDIGALFSALRGMLRPLVPAGSAVTLVFEAPVDLPPMFTDEPKLAQILRNFISNALKFTARGEVRVSAARGPGELVTFSVSDTGTGIAPEDQARIFDEWVQLQSPLQANVRGTGLGLPLSRRLAKLLGGTVRVKSKLGLGSTFYAVIPARIEAAGDTALFGEDSAARAPASDNAQQGTILVIDDDEASRYILRGLLGELRYRVIEATNGPDGLEMARALGPSAVFTDLVMDGMNGIDVVDAMAKDDVLASIPVIVHTAKQLSAVERTRLAGATAVVSKESPSRLASLENIRSALGAAGLGEKRPRRPHARS